MIKSTWVLFFALCLLSPEAKAEGTSPKLQAELAEAAPFIVARSKLSAPETSKLVYMGLQIKQAYEDARHAQENKVETDRRIKDSIDNARRYVDGVSFRNGLLEAGLKAAGQVYFSRSAGTTSTVMQKGFDVAVEKGLDAISRPGNFPAAFTTDDLLATTQWMYSEAAKKDSPLRNYFLDEIRTYHHLEADRALFDPTVTAELRFKDLSKYLADINSDIGKLAGRLDDQTAIQKSLSDQSGVLTRRCENACWRYGSGFSPGA